MTTIAYRSGVLAADTLVTSGMTVEGAVSKISRSGLDLIAATGDVALCQRFAAWAAAGAQGEPPAMKCDGGEAMGLIFRPDGSLTKYHPDRPALTLRAPFYAYGSGGWIALGAMEFGASATDAVGAAMKWDAATGGEVETLTHGSAE